MLPIFESLSDEAQDELVESLENESNYDIPNVGQAKWVTYDRHNAECWIIFELLGKLYRMDGHYDSWAGTEYEGLDGVYEVERKTKTVVIYPKKGA